MTSFGWLESSVAQLNRLLVGVDHSAKSNRKYREFERYLANIVQVDPQKIYTAYVSKAGNSAVRFNQSARARNARLLVALVEPPADEPLDRTIDALTRYCAQAVRQIELLVFAKIDEAWQPHSIIYPIGNPPVLLTPFLQMWPYLRHVAPPPEEELSRVSTAQFRDGDRLLLDIDVRNVEEPIVEPANVKDLGRDLRFVAVDEDLPVPRVSYPYAVLRRDGWVDDSIQSMFLLSLHLSPAVHVEVGEIKILQEGQHAGPTSMPERPFSRLGTKYYSLGQSYSFYETLHGLGKQVYRPVLRKLKDIVFNPDRRSRFQNEPAFRTSLLRTGKAVRALDDSPNLFVEEQRNNTSDGMQFDFATKVGGDPFEITFTFADSSNLLPDRINAIIGYNGTGKTQLLAHIALVATGDLQQREELSRYGSIRNSETIRFSAVIAISYSAFDTFVLPDAFWRVEEKNMARERLEDTGEVFGYTYCGLRRRAGNQRQGLRSSPRNLKTINEITKEFIRAVARATSPKKREAWIKAISIIKDEPSFSRIEMEGYGEEQGKASWRAHFDDLSTGHKIVLNILAQVIGHVEPGSLILIDEPESHLHPSLLAALIRALNDILGRFDSYAIVATHSPVVVQEIPRRYVHILQRFGEKTIVDDPPIETFGENVGQLTTNVFDLDNTKTDYHSVLAKLAESMTIDEIDDLFEDEMSVQARAYVLGLKRRSRR